MPRYKPTEISGYRLGNLGAVPVVTWDEQGKRRRFRLGSALTQEQAEAELQAFVKRREVYQARSGHKVQDLHDAYCADRRLDGKSIANQEQHWKALAPVFGHLSPSDIDKRICKDYARRRMAAGRKVGTIWTELTDLRTILNWAAKNDLITKAPNITIPPKPAPRDKRLTKEEARTLLDACGPAHLRLFVVLNLATAARAGALLGLRWDRIDLERGLINLHDPEIEETTKRRAIVPINSTAKAALAAAKPMALSDWVIEWNGAPLKSIKKALKSAGKDAGLEWVSPHVLRHTAATWMAEAGVPMSEISQYLGHSSTSVTEKVYARYSPDYLRTAAAALEMPTAQLRSVGA